MWLSITLIPASFSELLQYAGDLQILRDMDGNVRDFLLLSLQNHEVASRCQDYQMRTSSEDSK